MAGHQRKESLVRLALIDSWETPLLLSGLWTSSGTFDTIGSAMLYGLSRYCLSQRKEISQRRKSPLGWDFLA